MQRSLRKLRELHYSRSAHTLADQTKANPLDLSGQGSAKFSELRYSRSTVTLADQTRGKTANVRERGTAKFDLRVSVGAGSILGSRPADESAVFPEFG